MNPKEKNTKSQYTCGDYREEMILLSLRQRLRDAKLTAAEKKKLERDISHHTKKLGF